MTPDLRERAKRAIQVITVDGRNLSGGQAMLFAFHEIGWHPMLALWGQRVPFIWFVELGYRIVARNRSLFSRFMFRATDADQSIEQESTDA